MLDQYITLCLRVQLLGDGHFVSYEEGGLCCGLFLLPGVMELRAVILLSIVGATAEQKDTLPTEFGILEMVDLDGIGVILEMSKLALVGNGRD